MGSQSTVYGFIQLDGNFLEHYQQTIDAFEFDDVYPFTNIFRHATSGYRGSVASFAGNYKTLFEDWEEWEYRFEQLLSRLHARSAVVRLEDEIVGDRPRIDYVCSDGWQPDIPPKNRRWSKFKTDLDGNQSETEGLLPLAAEPSSNEFEPPP